KTEIAGYAYTQYYTHYYGEETIVDARKERLERARGFVRGLFNRGSRAHAAVVEPAGAAESRADAVDSASAPAEPDAFEMPTLRSAKSKRLLMGAVAVALLAALGGLAGWRLGWFGGNQKPKEMLRQRLEAPASP